MGSLIHTAVTVTNIRNYIPITLEAENGQYTSWVELFKVHYRAFEVLNHIIPAPSSSSSSGTKTAAVKDNLSTETDAQWSRLDAIVLQWIYGTISKDLLITILSPNTTAAAAAWKALEHIFIDSKLGVGMCLGQMATYILNILPHKTKHYSTPTFLLYNKVPTYDHLRVFGCLCYPLIPYTTIHKLANRSLPCIFLGFPTNHRGYKCYDLSSHKIIINRHVFFDEYVFPFAKPHSSPPSYDFLSSSPTIHPTLWDSVATTPLSSHSMTPPSSVQTPPPTTPTTPDQNQPTPTEPPPNTQHTPPIETYQR